MDTEQLTGWRQTYDVWASALNAAYRDLLAASTALVPNLLGATLLLLGGWCLALLVRVLILRLGTGLDRLFQTARTRAGRTDLPLRWPASRIVAYSAYWIVILFFVSVAASVLGLPDVADLFRQVLVYFPMLLLLGVGLWVVYEVSGAIADRLAQAGRARGWENPVLLGRLIRGFILTFAVIIVAGELGLDVTLFINIVSLAVGAFLAGGALAFGLGAGGAVGNLVASHYVRRSYRVGQRVRIDGVEGEILELTPSAVVIDSLDGRVEVPARRFGETPCILLEDVPG